MQAFLISTPPVENQWDRNAEVFQQTMKVSKAGVTPGHSKHDFSEAYRQMLQGSVMYDKPFSVDDIPTIDTPTEIATVQEDCLWVADAMVKKGYNPALLNMASGGHPGGGVERGARAQEETICRRTTLACSLYQFSYRYAQKYGLPHKSGPNYPMEKEFGAVYSPSVTVLRGGVECDYLYLANPFQVGVISIAAINKKHFPEHFNEDGSFSTSGIDITKNRIRTIYRLGLKHGHDSLIIGAWGCGAFGNLPEDVASLFKIVLQEDEFKNKYRKVVAAVINDHNSQGRNYQVFAEIFK